ncbi:MAG: hypothetical protein WCA22_10105 [Candidatus Binatus sp.]
MTESLNASEESPLLYIPLLLTYAQYLFIGELGYMLGVALFFYYVGYLVRHRGQLAAISGWFFCLAGLILFATHLLPFCIALLVTGIFACFEWSRALIRKLIFAFSLPVTLTLWYALARFFSEPLASRGFWQFWTTARFAGAVVAVYTPFHKFLPWLTIGSRAVQVGAIANLVTLGVITLVWLACGAAIWFGRRGYLPAMVAAATCLFCFVATGFQFAEMISPGERFAYPALWLAICWLGSQWDPSEYPLISLLGRSLMCSLLIGQAIYLDVCVGTVSSRLGDLYAQLSATQSHGEFCSIYEAYRVESNDPAHRRGLNRFVTNHPTAPHVPYYIYAERGTESIISGSSMVRYYLGDGDRDDLCRP